MRTELYSCRLKKVCKSMLPRANHRTTRLTPYNVVNILQNEEGGKEVPGEHSQLSPTISPGERDEYLVLFHVTGSSFPILFNPHIDSPPLAKFQFLIALTYLQATHSHNHSLVPSLHLFRAASTTLAHSFTSKTLQISLRKSWSYINSPSLS